MKTIIYIIAGLIFLSIGPQLILGICPYSLRKLGDTERKNAAEIPARVSDYIMGHNGNPLDLRYVSDYYPLAKKAMPAWEKVLDGILGTETK